MWREKGNHLARLIVIFLVLGVSIWYFTPQSASASDKETLKQFWSDLYGQIAPRGHAEATGAMEFEWERLAKAGADECFYGPGNTSNLLSFVYPGNLNNQQKKDCISQGGHPKVNQAYVWGLVKSGDNLWFGTVANTLCLVLGGFFPPTLPSLNNSSWVCGEQGFGLLPFIKDFRPPRVFYYDLRGKKLTEVTQKIISGGDVGLLETTVGLRSAGAANGVVYLGGIASGVNIFAFDARTKEYLGAKAFPQYNNIRQWRMVEDALYVGMAKSGKGGGEILRWTGSKSNPFSYEIVGQVGGDPAYLTPHEGRLFVSVWPNTGWPKGGYPMSIWMSPKLRDNGKPTWTGAPNWTPVWDISKYEPELAVQATTAGGALMSYKGYLYWGTMLVPGTSFFTWQGMHPTAPTNDVDAALLATYRPINIFRGKDFDAGKPKVELLYGYSHLPKYDGGWKIVPNSMGQKPRFGLAGFGNFFNTYTWWMEVYKGQLFVGTFDFSYLVAAGIEGLLNIEFPEALTELAEKFWGADLWSFHSNTDPAVPVSLNGVDNNTNYGIRTMVSTEDSLYLGMANAMNLLTDPREEMGGWELIRLRAEWRSEEEHGEHDGPGR